MPTNVLDENVVILKFDNSNFKKNTEDSIKSLDRLKASLKNADGANSLKEIGVAAKEIDLSGIGRAIDNVNKRFTNMGVVGMAAINKLTSSAMSSVSGIAKAIPSQLVQGGWRRALNIEQAEFLMKGLGYTFEGTYDKITKKFEGVKGAVLASVDDTAYGLDEAAKLAATFLASGIKDTEELADRLKAVSGVAAVTSSDYASVGRIFAQVAGAGRMMGDDLNQLSDKGFNAAQEIVKYLNANRDLADQAIESAIAQGRQVKAMEEISTHAELTEADIRQMVSAGAISFDIMSNSLTHFFDTAQEANKTYTGSFANVRAALSRIGAQLEEPRLKNMTRIFNTLLPILKQLETFVTPFAKKIADTSSKITDFINEGVLNPIGKAIGLKPDQLFHGFANEIKKVGDVSEASSDQTKDLGDKIRVTAKEWKAAVSIWNTGAYGIGQERADAIRKLGMSYEHVQGIINKFYETQFNWEKTKKYFDVDGRKTKENKEQEKRSTEEIKRLYEQTRTLSILGKVVKGFVNLVKSAMNVLKAVKNIGTVIWKNIKNIVSLLGHGVSGVFYTITKIIYDATTKFLEFTELLKKGDKGVHDLANNFTLLSSAFHAIGTVCKWFAGIVVYVVSEIARFFYMIKDSSALNSLKEGIVGVGYAISKFIWGRLREIGKLIERIKKNISGNDGFVSLSHILYRIAEGFGNFLKSLTSGEKVVGSFTSSMGVAANKVIGLFTPVVDFLINTFGDAIITLIDFFTKLGESDGIKALKDSILDLSSALKQTEEPLDDVVLGVNSLSGISTNSGLDRIVLFFSNIAEALSNFIYAISKGTNPFKAFISTIKKIKNSTFSLFSDTFETVRNSAVTGKVGSGVGGLVTGVKNWVADIEQWLSEIGALDFITKKANYVVNGLEIIFNKIKHIDYSKAVNVITGAPWEKIAKSSFYIAGVISMFKMARDAGKLAKSASGMFNEIGEAFESFGDVAKAYKNQIKIKAFETIAISIGILVGSIVALAMIPSDRIKPALAAVVAIMGALTGIMLLMNSGKFDEKRLTSIGIAFAGVGASIILIATAMKLIASMTVEEIKKSGSVILAFIILMSLISIRSKEMTGVGAAFMGLAVALNLLVVAVVGFAMIPFDMLMRGGEIILGLMLALSLASRIAKSSKPGGFVAMSAALLLLIPSIVIFSMLPFDMIKRGGGVIVGFILAMALASRIAGEGKLSNLGKMAIIIAVLAAACVALSFIDTKRLMASAASISGMMISLGYAAKHAQKSAKGLAAMALVIATLAGALIALEKLAPKTATKNALAMAAFVGALGIVIAIFSKIVGGKTGGGFGVIAKASVGLCEAIDIFIANLLIIAALFSQLGYAMEKYLPEGQVDDVKRHVGLIGEILGTLIASFIKPIKDMLFEHYNDSKTLTIQFDGFIDNINDIMEAMDELGDGDLDTFKEFADAFSTLGSGSLKQSLANFFNSMSIFGWLGDNSIEDQIESFGKGLDSLVTICKEYDDDDMKKAKLAANIFRTFAKGISELGPTGGVATVFANTDLGEFGEQMSGFGSSMKDFIDEMDLIKLDKLKALMHVDNRGNPAPDSKLGLIASLVRALSNFETPPGGLKKFLQGYTDIATFGNQMTGFGQSMIDFIKEMDQVPWVKLNAFMKIDGEGNIAKDSKLGLILTMVKALDKAGTELDPSGGIKQLILGNTTLAEFMTDMAGDESGGGFGNGLRKFIKQMDMVPWAKLNALMKIDKEGNIANNSKLGLILIMVKAFGKLAEEEIPETGGLWGWIAGGTQDLGVFGAQIKNFVNAVKPAIEKLNEMSINDDVLGEGGKLEKITSIITKLNELDPPSETVIQAMSMWFRTKDDYDSIVKMIDMAEELSNVSFGKVDPVDAATKVKDTLGELKGIQPPSETVWEAFKTFMASIYDTGTITNVIDMIVDVGERGSAIDVNGVSTFYMASTSVTNSLALLREAQEAGIPTLVNLNGASQHLKDFTDKVRSIKTEDVEKNVDTVITAVKKLSAITTIAAEVDVAATSISEAGKKLGGSYISGVQDEKNMRDAAEAGKALVMAVWNYVKQEKHVKNFYDKGAAIAAGFLKGLKSKQDQIEKAAQAMVDAAEKAVEAEAQIKSPSKVFMKLGGFIGEGFVVGLESYSSRVYQAANKMATRSVLAANQAMESLELYGDPTITPVLDLTQVEAGAQRINALVTQQQAIAVNAGFDPATTQYATPWMMSELIDKMSSLAGNGNKNVFKNPDQSTEVVFNNYITVDGSENPEAFANRFVDQLKMQMRTT